MGTVVDFSHRPPPSPEVYEPVNYRPTDRCKTFVFDSEDGNNYATTFKAQGVQYAEGENLPAAYHVIETPDSAGALLRFTVEQPDGTVNIHHTHIDVECRTYPMDDIKILGLVFQFILDFKTGDRWERIRGPAREGVRDSIELPLFDIKG